MAVMNAPQQPGRPTALWLIWALSFGSLILAFPAYSVAVFAFDLDRKAVADIFALQVMLAYWVGIFAAYLPLACLRGWSRFQRLQAVCLPFLIASYATHLSWELIWVFAHDAISNARDSIWAYPWWAYIDGGDVRYHHPEASFLMIEILSIINGSIGVAGLWLLKRSEFSDYRGTLLCLSTAVTHTVLTWYYYGTEILTGFASVNTASVMDLWVKFIFLNGPWLVLPWFVMAWGVQLLKQQIPKPVSA
ncbi:MAG TPA: hypothetical protein VIM96_03295 [Pseudomonadales bacterium]